MNFSQSFAIGDATLAKIENDNKKSNSIQTPPNSLKLSFNQSLNDNICEESLTPSTVETDIIDVSPNVDLTIKQVRKRQKNSSVRGNKSKLHYDSPKQIGSDSPNLSSDGYREFFESNIDFTVTKLDGGWTNSNTDGWTDAVKETVGDLTKNYSEFFKESMEFRTQIQIIDNNELTGKDKIENLENNSLVANFLDAPLFTQEIQSTDRIDTPISLKRSINCSVENVVNKKIKITDQQDDESNGLGVIENVTFIEPNDEKFNSKNQSNYIANEMELAKDSVIIGLMNDEDESSMIRLNCSVLDRTKIVSLNLNESKLIDMKPLTTPTKNWNEIKNWGLPSSIAHQYHLKGIDKMFDWQVDCLKNSNVMTNYSNLVYSAPTSAGKTLVSEILLIKCVAERHKKAIFILPFVSVVREKMIYLKELLNPADISVEGFFGGYSTPGGGFDTISVAVCTIEKANSIVNRLLEQNTLSTIGTIVVDEIHLISDAGRGYILELLLAKILFMCRKHGHQIQIVTMSATLPNIDLLTEWLSAEFYRTDFRPIELKEMIKIGLTIFDNKSDILKVISPINNSIKDPDNIGQLCLETVLDGGSIIVFCPSKDWCESSSLHIAEFFHTILRTDSEIGQQLRNELIEKNLQDVKLQLSNCSTGLDSTLEKTITYGCAYHHAGLTSDERDIIESSFKSCALRIIVATSTLSSGVNLPARRVIIRTPMFAGKLMSSMTYKQMIGRAGRTGKDTMGESIIICNPTNSTAGRELIGAVLKPLYSCLGSENNAHWKRAILEIIAAGVATTQSDLEQFTKCTLFHVQRNHKRDDASNKDESEENSNPIKTCLDFLIEYEFIRQQKDEESDALYYVATRLGKACLASSMPPSDGFLLFSELQKARQCFVLESELQAIYLVTPFSVCYQLQNIDWLFFLDMWEKLSAASRRVGELIGIKESFLVRAMRGRSTQDHKLLQIHKRFYTALALQELVNEIPMNSVANKYKFSRGQLQTLQQMASTFAGICTSFCKALNWSILAMIIDQFQERLYFGVHSELIDLMKLSVLNGHRARALWDGGIQRIIDLANASVLSIEQIIFDSISFDTKRRDNETDFDAKRRNDARYIHITGCAGMTIREAAKIMIDHARKYVQCEIGTVAIEWKDSTTAQNDDEGFAGSEILNSTLSDHQRTPTKSKSFDSDCDQIDFSKPSPLKVLSVQQSTPNTPRYNEKGLLNLNIIDIDSNRCNFNKFAEEIDKVSNLSLSVAIGNVSDYQQKSLRIGYNLPTENVHPLPEILCSINNSKYISGISINWHARDIYYLNIQSNQEVPLAEKMSVLENIFRNENLTIKMINAKEQCKSLMKGIPSIKTIKCNLEDPVIAEWMIDIDKIAKLQQLTDTYAPQCNDISMHNITQYNPIERSKIRSAIECCSVRNILSDQLNKLSDPKNGNQLRKLFHSTEMPIQKLLASMELVGFSVDESELIDVSKRIETNISKFQENIYAIAGRRFNLESPKEIAKILGLNGKRGCTRKEMLSDMDNPLAAMITQYRTLNSTLSKSIKPLQKLIHSGRICGCSCSFTSTGRISMYDPNLQNVTKDFVLTIPGNPEWSEQISCRRSFKVPENRCLISADFCQLEFRIMTHLSGDKILQESIELSSDIFRSISAKWNNIPENKVSPNQRNETKQLCYGLIYGMGPKSLAKSMKCDEDYAKQLIQSFYEAYPGLKIYKNTIIKSARENGYVETLAGRRRYLPDIKCTNTVLRAQAERKAINTTIQGSAADISKFAILRMDRNLQKYEKTLNITTDHTVSDRSVNFVLHLHDELFYEAPIQIGKQIAKILKASMENCIKLQVPLSVNVKMGTNWGELVTINW